MKRILFAVLLFLVLLFSFVNIVYCEIDKTTVASSVIDGDTFDTTSGDRIRLADIDAPEFWEYGYIDAKVYLNTLIHEETVYLDIDDIYETDPYDRLVCVVYIDYNSTHLRNVNEMLLTLGYAVISDYNNEFDPYTWQLYASKETTEFQLDFTNIRTIVIIILLLYWQLSALSLFWIGRRKEGQLGYR